MKKTEKQDDLADLLHPLRNILQEAWRVKPEDKSHFTSILSELIDVADINGVPDEEIVGMLLWFAASRLAFDYPVRTRQHIIDELKRYVDDILEDHHPD